MESEQAYRSAETIEVVGQKMSQSQHNVMLEPDRAGLMPLAVAITELEGELESLYRALRPVLIEEGAVSEVPEMASVGMTSPLGDQVERLRDMRRRLGAHFARLDI